MIADREVAEQEGEFAELDEDPDSILLSEVELGGSGDSTSSTIIGGRSNPKNSAESDIQLAQPKRDSDIQLPQSKPGSDIQLVQKKHDSDLNLGFDSGSDVKSGSDVLTEGSGVSPMFDELDTLDLDMESAASSGISSNVTGGSSLNLGGAAGTSDVALGSDALKLEGSDLNLGGGGGDALVLGEAPTLEIEGSQAGGSDVDLTGDEDGDLVLGGSSHGGDLSRAGDSGISLLDPRDSGLSLESSPLQLGGSAVESLELGEDDLLLSDPPTSKSGPVAKAGRAGTGFRRRLFAYAVGRSRRRGIGQRLASDCPGYGRRIWRSHAGRQRRAGDGRRRIDGRRSRRGPGLGRCDR